MDVDDIMTTYFGDRKEEEEENDATNDNSDVISPLIRWSPSVHAAREEERRCLDINTVFNFAQQETCM